MKRNTIKSWSEKIFYTERNKELKNNTVKENNQKICGLSNYYYNYYYHHYCHYQYHYYNYYLALTSSEGGELIFAR